MKEHEQRQKREAEEARRRRKAGPIYDQLKQATELDDSHGNQAEAVLGLQQTYGNKYVQRLAEGSKEATLDEDIIRRIESQRSSGKPLEPEVRSQMEASFGRGFSDVRIHADAKANKLSRELGAQAFTTGKDIFFKEGAYVPQQLESKEVLAHELAHTVQQGGNTQSRRVSAGQIDDAFEHEAALAGQVVSEGGGVSVELQLAAPSLQCQAAPQGTGETVETVERRVIQRADLLIGQTYGPNLFRGFREGVMATYAGSAWQILDEYEAKRAWIAKYGAKPQSLLDYERANAWVDQSTDPPTVYFRRERGDFGTFVHEGLHFYSDKVLDRMCGDNVDEGVTEYFTRIITDANDFSRNIYNRQVDEVNALVPVVGQDALRAAYFRGEIEALEFWGPFGGFWDWVGYMQANNYSNARNVVTAQPIVRFRPATEPIPVP